MKPHEHDIMRSVEDHYWWYQALRNATLLPPIALVRWLSRMRLARAPAEARSDFRPLPGPVNSMLRGVAALELGPSRHLSLPFGTSVFAVARKKHG